MLDYTDFNFDIDCDGIPDSFAEEVDLDSDGIADAVSIDTDGDGVADVLYQETDTNVDGIPDAAQYGIDTNIDGIIDHYEISYDTDGNGVADTYVSKNDYNQDGIDDDITTSFDSDENGIFEQTTVEYDSNGDTVMDTAENHFDYDQNSIIDSSTTGQFVDLDDDGVFDTFINAIDENGDTVFESVEVYDYDTETDELYLDSIEEIDMPDEGENGMYAYELDNFDPDSAEPDDVIGNPEGAMEEWDYQGDTNRCAVYSQKFVIEEMTGQELDIEELADLAEENGWFSEEGGTPLLNMDKILDHYGIDNEMSFHNDYDDLANALANGEKVIVAIDADEIWHGENDDIFAPNDGANHAVEVIGIDNSNPDNPMVILNDSGNPDGCGEMVPLDTFMDAWDDSANQMITAF